MKYPLDCENRFEKSLLFWLGRFLRNKLTSLSNRTVEDKDAFNLILKKLNHNISSLNELSSLAKQARNIGLSGINTYFKPLEKMYIYLETFGFASLKELDEEVLSDFLSVQTSKLSDATKKNHKIAVVNFFKYIDKQNDEQFAFNIELKNWGGLKASNANKLPQHLSEEEIEKFINGIETYQFQTSIQDRNRLLLKLIMFTGIRVGEALNIKLKDIYDEDNVFIISIQGKGNKYRSVMIKKEHIQSYLDSYLTIRSCQNDLLFCNKKGTSLTQAYVSRIVEKILLGCGIRKEKNGAHLLRHSFATLLYKKRKDLVLVQEALGHASLNTSRIYTHFDKDKLYSAASVMDKF